MAESLVCAVAVGLAVAAMSVAVVVALLKAPRRR
jgi:hypothetical protein